MSEEITRPPFSTSAEVKLVVAALHKVPVNGRITHRELSQAMGESALSARGRAIVRKSRLRLEAGAGIVFRALNGVGLERCDEPAKVDVAKNGVRSVHRKVRRSLKILDAVQIEYLEEVNRQSYILNKTILGMLKQASGSRFDKALKERLGDCDENFGGTDLLRLFNRKRSGSKDS